MSSDDLQELDGALRAFLREDLPEGDRTAEALVPAEREASARFVAKAPGVLSGMEVAHRVLRSCEPSAVGRSLVEEGQRIEPGQLLATWQGSARALLAAERLALNLVQRMSGIATATARFVERTAGTPARILDTRKTAPGLRAFDRRAVRAGGGHNHRWGLSDQVLIKENHLASLPRGPEGLRPIEEGLRRARERAGGCIVEIEVFDVAEAERAVAAGADIVLLDNFEVEQVREAVRRLGDRGALLEASGGIDLETVADYARTGVHRISVGSLTHSSPALDVSLLFDDDPAGR